MLDLEAILSPDRLESLGGSRPERFRATDLWAGWTETTVRTTMTAQGRSTGESTMKQIVPPLLLLLVSSLFSPSIRAQPLETITLKSGTIANLTPVMAHQARCVALSEKLGLLAFGHERAYPDAQISIFKLDEQGKPAPFATTLKMPLPETLRKLDKLKPSNQVSSLAFHPRLPLLYVWRDVNLLWTIPPKFNAETKDYDHLLVYDVAKNPPELVLSLCRGLEYLHGAVTGGLAVDPEGEALFIPNLRDLSTPTFWRFARLLLDADGLPNVWGDAVSAKEPVPVRLKKLSAWNEDPKSSPRDRTPLELLTIFGHGGTQSLWAYSKAVAFAGGLNGVFSWRPDDKEICLTSVGLKKAGYTFLTSHAKVPALFAVRHHSDSFFRVDQVEGYLSLLPRQWILPERKLLGTPALLIKSNQLAIGGEHRIYVISLDAQAMPRREAIQMHVFNPAVQTLVYSEKFDRLYVSVDLSK